VRYVQVSQLAMPTLARMFVVQPIGCPLVAPPPNGDVHALRSKETFMSKLLDGEEAFVDRRGLRDIFGITLSRTEIDRREERGEFPRRHKAGNHPNSRVFYVRSEVAAWIRAEIAKRNEQISRNNSHGLTVLG
jgi:predicted DNA-binding transcriptional regulator AlpA